MVGYPQTTYNDRQLVSCYAVQFFASYSFQTTRNNETSRNRTTVLVFVFVSVFA